MKIGMVAATQIPCPPPADSVEREYLAALGQVDGWRTERLGTVLGERGRRTKLLPLSKPPCRSAALEATLDSDR